MRYCGEARGQEMLIVQKLGGVSALRSRSAVLILSGLLGVGCSSKTPPQGSDKAESKVKASAPAPVPVAMYRGPKTKALLTLKGAGQDLRSGLNVRANAPLELSLTLPSGDSWNRARIGRAVLRQPDGSQIELGSQGLLAKLRSRSQVAPLPLPDLMPGTSMIIVSAGAGDAGPGRDDMAGNRHFSKLIVSKADASGKVPLAQSGVMQKTGQLLEIRPVSLPMALRVGDEMAVKVYENQSHRGNAELEIHHPDGEVEVLHTKPNGMAYFEVRETGVHHIAFHTEMEQEPASAQLTFEVSQGETK